jgi:hypothetical protein
MASVFANSLPRQVCGPPPNGIKVKGGGACSNLDGSNFVGLGKKIGDM